MSRRLRRFVVGSGVALSAIGALAAAMVPLRGHLSVATTALVLVVPVVVGVVLGGFGVGVLSVMAGFVVYDVLFIPPYGTLSVGRSEDWVALGVWAAVMLLVARVVSQLARARAEAGRREEDMRRLYRLSELLVEGEREAESLTRVVHSVRDTFGLASVVLLLDRDGVLEPVAQAGTAWSEEEIQRLVPRPGVPEPVGIGSTDEVRMLALAATGSPVGMLGIRGPVQRAEDRELLRTFTNHIALMVERARLRQQVVRAELLDEVERLQKALMGAVSHDLRSPLATIKVSASTLREPGLPLDDHDRQELLASIDAQADRLSRLVTNLLDMTRIQSGALRVAPQPVAVVDLVHESLRSLAVTPDAAALSLEIADGLPLVDVDHVLVGQVLVNLTENALRFSPGGDVIVGAHRRDDGLVEMQVADRGPGVPAEERLDVFGLFHRVGPGEGTGVGLAIAKAFVEAHGQTIWVTERVGGGAMFCFTLPVLADPPELA